MEITKAIEIVTSAQKAIDTVDDYGRYHFREWKKGVNGHCWYIKTEIENKDTLIIHYGYGEDFEGSYKLEL